MKTSSRVRTAAGPLLAAALLAVLASCSDNGGITVQQQVENIRFVTHPPDVRIGEPFTVAVELVDSNGSRVTDATNTVTLQLSSGGGLGGTTSRAAVSGLATFEGLTVSEAGDNRRLDASSGQHSAVSQAFTVVDPCQVAGAGGVNPGQTVSGQLTPFSCELNDGSFADVWRLELGSRTSVRIDLTSGQFDAFLLLLDANLGLITFDDDGGAGSDARIAWTLEAGTYFILANSFGPGETGSYQLSVQQVDPCLTVVGALGVDESGTGTLRTDSCLVGGQWYTDRWRLTVTNEESVQIDLVSGEFDAFLILRNEAGDLVAEDDDGGDGTNARLVETLQPGSYIIEASTFDPFETGAYELSVTR